MVGDWLVVSTHLKNISQIGFLPQVGVKIKNIWNHHLDYQGHKVGVENAPKKKRLDDEWKLKMISQGWSFLQNADMGWFFWMCYVF